MDIFIQLAQQSGVANLGIGNLVMFVIAGILIYLAITKEYEPLLLIPIGFGAILANLPLAHMGAEGPHVPRTNPVAWPLGNAQHRPALRLLMRREIGRASCRERV